MMDACAVEEEYKEKAFVAALSTPQAIKGPPSTFQRSANKKQRNKITEKSAKTQKSDLGLLLSLLLGLLLGLFLGLLLTRTG